jgi:hypothetical protein
VPASNLEKSTVMKCCLPMFSHTFKNKVHDDVALVSVLHKCPKVVLEMQYYVKLQ